MAEQMQRNPINGANVEPPTIDQVALHFDYDSIDNTSARRMAQDGARQIKTLMVRTLENIWTIGEIARQVKARLPHGTFVAWAETEFLSDFGVSLRTLQRWMQLADRVEIDDVKDSGIPLTGWMLLSAPNTPEAVRQEAIQKAKGGDVVTVDQIRQMKEAANEERLSAPDDWREAHRDRLLGYYNRMTTEAARIRDLGHGAFAVRLEDWILQPLEAYLEMLEEADLPPMQNDDPGSGETPEPSFVVVDDE